MKITPTLYAKMYLNLANKAGKQLDQLAKLFWRQVLERGHFSWRSKIVAEVKIMLRQQQGVTLVQLAVPKLIEKNLYQELSKKFADILKSKVELEIVIKPHLLAGMVATFNDQRFDGSLKGRLDDLYKTLSGQALPE